MKPRLPELRQQLRRIHWAIYALRSVCKCDPCATAVPRLYEIFVACGRAALRGHTSFNLSCTSSWAEDSPVITTMFAMVLVSRSGSDKVGCGMGDRYETRSQEIWNGEIQDMTYIKRFIYFRSTMFIHQQFIQKLIHRNNLCTTCDSTRQTKSRPAVL